MAVLAVDLGATKIAFGLYDDQGQILQKESVLLNGRQAGQVADLLVEHLQAMSDRSQTEIKAMGVCVPGIYYADSGCVWAPNIPGWQQYPLLRQLQQNFSQKIALDSDRACYILGEAWQGAAQDCRNAIFMAVGTGIGAGILVDGKILRGSSDAAGAIGWLALHKPYDARYAPCGCFEYHASGPGLVQVAQEFLREGVLPSLLSPTNLTSTQIFAAFEQNDPVAVKVLEQAVAYWAMATANLVSLFNPQVIIFGGGVFGPAVRFLDEIYRQACQWAQPVSIKQVRLRPSRLAGNAGLYGAAKLAFDKIAKVVHE